MTNKLPKQLASNIILTVSVIAVCIGLIEISLALLHPVSFFAPPTALDGDAWRKLYHQPSKIPGLAYEIAPNKGQHTNQLYNMEINSYGMRDIEPQPVDDRSTCRIAVVGDSFTFGFGVDRNETYPNLLENNLGNKGYDKPVEVLNFGVGGYSTHDESLVVKYKVQQWKPQLIIVGYYLNDPDLNPASPLFLYYKETEWWQQWNLLRLIAESWRAFNVRIFGGGDYIRYLHSTGRPNWKSVTAAFEDIGGITKDTGTPVLLVIFPDIHKNIWGDYPYLDLHRQVSMAGYNENFKVIDLYETYKNYPAKSLMVRPGDPHPSKFGHMLAASEITKLIRKETLLDCDDVMEK